MLRKIRLFTPGPTPLLPAAQFSMGAADMHHRTAEFRALYLRVLQQLQTFIGTRNEVIVMAASGTGAMEASISNLVNRGEKILVLSAGKFGERWVSLGKVYGCDVTVVSAPYGEAIDIEAVRRQLTPELRAIYMQATETSTGVRHCVPAVAELIRGTDTLLVVDAITGLGTTDLVVDDQIDVVVGGSQKALMIPPGLAYCAVSERAWQRMQACTQPRYYFDLQKERKSAAKGESAYTPAVALIAAMGAALDYIANLGEGDIAAGRRKLVRNAELGASMTRSAMLALGLELFAPSAPSAAVTAVKAPAGIKSGDVVKKFKAEFGGILSDGQGEMQGHIFRIAHIGYLDYMDTIAIVAGLEQVIAELMPGKVKLGLALAAAQETYAQARAGSAPELCPCGRKSAACLAQHAVKSSGQGK